MNPSVLLTELLLAAPAPSDGEEFTPVSVSPGLPGFFATFVLAALLVLLLVDMSRRVRRVNAASRVRERYEAQERRDAAQEQRDEDPIEYDGIDRTDGIDRADGVDRTDAAEGPGDGTPRD